MTESPQESRSHLPSGGQVLDATTYAAERAGARIQRPGEEMAETARDDTGPDPGPVQ